MILVPSNTELKQNLNVVVTQALGKVVRKAFASVHPSEFDNINVTDAGHTELPEIKPGSGEYVALATFWR